MTLDEAIARAEEQAKAIPCKECALEHKQLAAWLRELKENRAEQECEITTYRDICATVERYKSKQ